MIGSIEWSEGWMPVSYNLKEHGVYDEERFCMQRMSKRIPPLKSMRRMRLMSKDGERATWSLYWKSQIPLICPERVLFSL